jgi:hypothetical protein
VAALRRQIERPTAEAHRQSTSRVPVPFPFLSRYNAAAELLEQREANVLGIPGVLHGPSCKLQHGGTVVSVGDSRKACLGMGFTFPFVPGHAYCQRHGHKRCKPETAANFADPHWHQAEVNKGRNDAAYPISVGPPRIEPTERPAATQRAAQRRRSPASIAGKPTRPCRKPHRKLVKTSVRRDDRAIALVRCWPDVSGPSAATNQFPHADCALAMEPIGTSIIGTWPSLISKQT